LQYFNFENVYYIFSRSIDNWWIYGIMSLSKANLFVTPLCLPDKKSAYRLYICPNNFSNDLNMLYFYSYWQDGLGENVRWPSLYVLQCTSVFVQSYVRFPIDFSSLFVFSLSAPLENIICGQKALTQIRYFIFHVFEQS